MTIQRTSHAVYDTSYHLVWCPKYRKKVFERADLRERAGQLIREISEDYGFDVIEMEIFILSVSGRIAQQKYFLDTPAAIHPLFTYECS